MSCTLDICGYGWLRKTDEFSGKKTYKCLSFTGACWGVQRYCHVCSVRDEDNNQVWICHKVGDEHAKIWVNAYVALPFTAILTTSAQGHNWASTSLMRRCCYAYKSRGEWERWGYGENAILSTSSLQLLRHRWRVAIVAQTQGEGLGNATNLLAAVDR